MGFYCYNLITQNQSIPRIQMLRQLACGGTIGNDLGLWQKKIRGCLVYEFKDTFLIFKQHYPYFYTLFYLHIFS